MPVLKAVKVKIFQIFVEIEIPVVRNVASWMHESWCLGKVKNNKRARQ